MYEPSAGRADDAGDEAPSRYRDHRSRPPRELARPDRKTQAHTVVSGKCQRYKSLIAGGFGY